MNKLAKVIQTTLSQRTPKRLLNASATDHHLSYRRDQGTASIRIVGDAVTPLTQSAYKLGYCRVSSDHQDVKRSNTNFYGDYIPASLSQEISAISLNHRLVASALSISIQIFLQLPAMTDPSTDERSMKQELRGSIKPSG